MTASRHEQIGVHFLEARGLESAERRRYLAKLAARDAGLAGEVASLLAADENEVDVLDRTDALGLAEIERQPDAGHLLHSKVGPYTIQRVIAAGGMGTVYEAIQENPQRTVALKVLRRGLSSPSASRRFGFEAQILGRLQHPGIAQIFEAGVHTSATDRLPYFVMEYIPDASTLTDYARGNKLDLRQRLELFAQVCDIVHYGHEQGVIHRDLKPSNILVG